MDDVLVLVLLTLAAARVVRLAVADAIPPLARARSWVGAHGDAWEYLTSCPWCVGVWVAAALTAAADIWLSVPAPVLTAGAVAYVAGWVVAVESHDDPEGP